MSARNRILHLVEFANTDAEALDRVQAALDGYRARRARKHVEIAERKRREKYEREHPPAPILKPHTATPIEGGFQCSKCGATWTYEDGGTTTGCA